MSDKLRHSDEWQNYQLSKTQSFTPPPTVVKKCKKVTFTVFMTWLNEFCGETLITAVNMRRQNDTVYFNHYIDVEWSSKNHQSHFSDHHLCYSLQEQSKYTRYYDLCNELWIAIRPYC